MSNIKEKIAKFYSEGIPKYRIDEICNISRGRVMSKDYISENRGEYPVYSSQTENDGQLGAISTYDYDGEYLTWTTDGANAGSVFYRNGKFSVTNVCGLLKVLNDSVLAKYLMYVLAFEAPKYVSKGMGNPKLMSNVMARIKVPIPSIEVQREVIDMLDSFTALGQLLNKEKAAFDKLFNEVAYRLLIKNNNGIEYRIKNICTLEKGKTAIQKAVPGMYPLVVTTTERKTCDQYQFDKAAVCIPLVSSRGHGVASLNHVFYQEGQYALGNILCAMIPIDESLVSAKYLYYYFECTKDYTLVPLMKGGANVSMHISDIEKVKLSIPSKDDQEKIIEKLEVLEKYCDILLPNEIDSRKEQNKFFTKKLMSYLNTGIDAEV